MANIHRHHVSFTLTVETDQYADGDLMTDVAEIPRALPSGHGPAIITDIVVVDTGDVGGDFDIYFTRSTTSWGTVNAAVSVADAIAADITGKIAIASSDYDDFANNKVAFKDGITIPIERSNDASSSINVVTVSRATNQYTATTDLTIELGIQLN